jgi:hypothetical protein
LCHICRPFQEKTESSVVETEDLKRTIKVCMFDQYGTVVDMQTGAAGTPRPREW